MGILSGSLGPEFFARCYTPLGEVMDMMTLVNCMINFILYCTMSRQFRTTFRKIFGMKSGGSKFRGGGGAKQSPVDNIYIEKYLMVPQAQSNNNKLDSLSVSGPGPRRESSGTVPHQLGPGVV